MNTWENVYPGRHIVEVSLKCVKLDTHDEFGTLLVPGS